MYGDDTYQESDIHDFVRSHGNLEQSNRLTDPRLAQAGRIDLLFRFRDTQTPALGFRHTSQDLYTLIYLDPTIASQWADEWEIPPGKNQPPSASFIDIAHLEEVNASVDAMRASLFGKNEQEMPARSSAVALLYRVAHAGHEISAYEATQIYDLAKALETFLGSIATIGGHNRKR